MYFNQEPLWSTFLILRPSVFLFSVFIHVSSQPHSSPFTFLIVFTLFKPYFISTWVLDLAMGLGDVFSSGLQF